VVGHSSACALVAELATKMVVSGLILVDGEIPPAHGATSAVRPALLAFIEGLADETGTLPVWSRWFADDAARASLVGIDILQRDAAALAQFERGLPRLRVDWFSDKIELGRWDHVPAGYIQTSQIYDHATAEAHRRGWPVAKLNGTHLDPALRPVEMSEAITSMTRRLVVRQTPIELRTARSTDLDTVAQVWHESASLPGVGPPIMPTLLELRERVDIELEAGWKLTVAVSDREIVGILALRPATSVLDQLFVRPGSIGSGVGKILLLEAMNSMPDGFTLFTASTNHRARKFYEQGGLMFLSESPHPRTGHPVSYYGWKVR
jgi:ribosomal protein S18 acetylase RimI-like enzyme